jgi:hypothetical protein
MQKSTIVSIPDSNDIDVGGGISMSAPTELPECARYSSGADEVIFVEIEEAMSLEALS